MKQYVYQLSLRKADNEKKKFIIESDIIYTNEEISKEKMKEISQTNKCDVHVQFIGYLMTRKETEEPMVIAYHTKEEIEQKLNEWRKLEERTA